MIYIKKDRPEGGASERPVQGLASENNCKIIISHLARKCKSQTLAGEGVDLL